jgi:hypothetical protein
MRARGLSPWRSSVRPDASSSAAAPSLICELLAAVIAPSGLNAGLSAPIRARSGSKRMPSSTVKGIEN